MYEEKPLIPEEIKNENDLKQQIIDLLNKFISENKLNLSKARDFKLIKFSFETKIWQSIEE